MSSLPIRERIIRKIAARTNAGRQLPTYDERDLPITTIAEGDDSASEGLYGLTNVTTTIAIVRSIRISGIKDDNWLTELNSALAQLIAEVFAGGDTLDGLAQGMEYVSGAVGPLVEGGLGSDVAVTVNVRYSWVHGNPYSQDADSAFTDLSDDEESDDETEEED